MPTSDQDALSWLRKFEAACRGRDFDTGRLMFAQDAVAFGTWAMAVHGLDNIEREQWRQIGVGDRRVAAADQADHGRGLVRGDDLVAERRALLTFPALARADWAVVDRADPTYGDRRHPNADPSD